MKYYQKIKLSGWEDCAQQTMQHLADTTDILEEPRAFWNQLDPTANANIFQLWTPLFDAYGFLLRELAVLIVNYEDIPIHQDRDHDSGTSKARVNIPLLNCQGTSTQFFQAHTWQPKEMVLHNGVKYIYHDQVNCKLEDSVEIDQPTVIRVQELHNVVCNQGPKPRITLSCFLTPDPVCLLEETHETQQNI